MDTLRSLYEKTSFRLTNNGCISFLIHSDIRLNQGGVASGLLFKKYMADMGDLVFVSASRRSFTCIFYEMMIPYP